MSKAMQLVGILLLGIFTLVIINLMNDVRSTDELDYYLLQEVTEAAMYDAVDYSYYRESGLLKVDRDMFLESFNRRFAESVSADREYEIKIIDFNETPPKVSVEVTAPTVATVAGEVALITNSVNGIIETIYDDYVYSVGDYNSNKYDESKPTILFEEINNTTYKVKINDDLYLKGYKVVKITNSNKNSAETICTSVDKWDNPSRWPNSIVFNQKLELTDTGFWIAAMDGAGNCTVKPLSDINPWLSLTYDEIPSNTDLVATLYDDHGLSKYYIAPSSWSINDVIKNCSNNSQCKSYNIDQKSVKVNTDGYYYYKFSTKLNKLGLDYGDYKLFVVDNKGRTVSSENILKLKKSHKPTIEYTYSSTSATAGTLTLKFKDEEDFIAYKYSTSDVKPINDTDYDWKGSPTKEKTITKNNVTAGTYYVWAKDKQNEITKMKLVIDLEELTSVPVCSNGTYNEKTKKCDYTCNDSCIKYGQKDGSCKEYGLKDGTKCLEEDKNNCTCQIRTYVCDVTTCGCGSSTSKFRAGSSDIQSFQIGCPSAYFKGCTTSKESNRSICPETLEDKSGETCNREQGAINRKCKCKKYEQVTDYDNCLEYNKVTDYDNCLEYNKKTCQADPGYDYNCPNGYENSNNIACKKVTAS